MGTKIGVISDVHGNLPALVAILNHLRKYNVNEIIHTGDVVDIGNQSKDCLKLLIDSGCTMIMGNHDYDYLLRRDRHLPFSHVSGEHKTFVFNSVGDEYRDIVKTFPLYVIRQIGNARIAFTHYALKNEIVEGQYFFKNMELNPNANSFDRMFDNIKADAVFFGHKHEPCDIMGKKLYVDVGSVGCHERPFARGIVIYAEDNGSWHYQRVETPYDRENLKQQMLSSDLPDAQFMFDFYFDRSIK
ncbi:MAG: metallophosphatase family protein [Corallococcus sp.]|nr:metallophosphatase family protein [Corallococcus sp.]